MRRKGLYRHPDRCNIYNFLIRLNREMKQKGIKLTRQPHPNFDCISSGPFDIDEASLPKRWLNFLDLELAIEIYTPLDQLFLTDSDFWRACNSLQLDETVALYTSGLLGDASYIGLVNNKHALVPLSTLQAGYRRRLTQLIVAVNQMNVPDAFLLRFRREAV